MKRLQLVFLLIIITTYNSVGQQKQIQLANEYYFQGEIDKAQDLYGQLVKKAGNIPHIHNNYVQLLTTTKQFDIAEKYLKKVISKFPYNDLYALDLALLYKSQDKLDKYDKGIASLVKKTGNSPNKILGLAQRFVRRNIPEEALQLYQKGRKIAKSPYAYSIQMANIHRITGNKDQMIDEYLNYARENPRRISYVKNVLQNTLTEENEFDQLEFKLIDLVQDNPDESIYPDLLIWVYLQRKDFQSAFIQAKAFDKRINGEGAEVINIGSIALSNESYVESIKIFDYVANTYPESPNYLFARRMSIKAQEEKVKRTYPVDLEEIKSLSVKYQQLFDSSKGSNHGLEAMRSKAQLQAFYLDNLEGSINILLRLIENPRASRTFIATCKLDLGDIYLLADQSWESTLLYSQVEKTFEDSPLAYDAKLKNAKLHYYQGDFSLAKSHLDILKIATTREISNDAISLSLLVTTNSFLDSTDAPLQKYAKTDLLIYQNKREEALSTLQSMLKEYPDHSLKDEIYWSIAKIYREEGNPEKAIEMLEKLLLSYDTDILGDDAYYTVAHIYENDLNNLEKAKEYYENFLTKYPGSVFIADARKNFRKLRGDIIN